MATVLVAESENSFNVANWERKSVLSINEFTPATTEELHKPRNILWPSEDVLECQHPVTSEDVASDVRASRRAKRGSERIPYSRVRSELGLD